MHLSIIIATFNCKEQLEETLGSLLEQDFNEYEVLIIDGGSTDGTLDTIKSIDGKLGNRVRWISEPDDGVYSAMNKGISKAHGRYLQFMNAGDKYTTSEVLSNVFALADDDPDIMFGDIYLTDEHFNTLHHVTYSEFSLKQLRCRGTATCNHQAFFIRREMAPMFSDIYKIKGELNWYIDIVQQHPGIYAKHIDAPLVLYALGGLGYKRFWSNLREWILLVQRRFGTSQNIHNIPRYWRFIKYRYPRLKKLPF
ncbi:glycosyltransferase [Oceanidesulfovibrio marinus]|uniref:Glycosyltransferase 2-like domain-containing protein n=1 Tax=Oceanidesulfovibrio marinus TaxID=370038 RepID=A0A6P1ZK28_9BACT|nr:glycosyltransferase [Oceanidesulfovibrio marinus]TVM36071.1 hypothetical protein DQK91_05355 [Oceanidesulfovibrio marinus]